MALSENIILDGQIIGELQSKITDLFYVDRLETPREAPQRYHYFHWKPADER